VTGSMKTRMHCTVIRLAAVTLALVTLLSPAAGHIGVAMLCAVSGQAGAARLLRGGLQLQL